MFAAFSTSERIVILVVAAASVALVASLLRINITGVFTYAIAHIQAVAQ